MIKVFLVVAVTFCSLFASAQGKRLYKKSVPTPTISGFKYGNHERHIIDFWQAKSEKPTPLIFMIHGGAWKNGDMTKISKYMDTKKFLDNGISVCAIHYRLMEHVSTKMPPVKVPLSDALRALQTVRTKAKEWNIDKNAIYAVGGSAGACTSLWLALHDDMADPKNSDPVKRESTRFAGAALCYPQTTLDPRQMKEWIPNSKYGGHAFGKEGFNSFLNSRKEILPWIKEYSPIEHVSADDPEIYLTYKYKPKMGKTVKDPTHSTNFGVKFQEKCEAFGVKCKLHYPGKRDIPSNPTSYLLDLIKKKGNNK